MQRANKGVMNNARAVSVSLPEVYFTSVICPINYYKHFILPGDGLSPLESIEAFLSIWASVVLGHRFFT